MSAHRNGSRYGSEFFRIMALYGLKNNHRDVLRLIFSEQRRARDLIRRNDPSGIHAALSLRTALR